MTSINTGLDQLPPVTQDQPPPERVPAGVDVIADLAARIARDALADARQEALDLLAYGWQAELERQAIHYADPTYCPHCDKHGCIVRADGTHAGCGRPVRP